MSKRQFRLPSPALIISMLALAVALGGTAVAATSGTHADAKADTKLVKALAPKLSVKHATNATNATHVTHLPSILASGETLTGNYGVLGANGHNGYYGITFAVPLASGPTINYIVAGDSVPAACAGGTVAAPKANPGNLCIFEAFHGGDTPGAFDPATNSTTVANPMGAVVFTSSSAGTASNAEGTWAVTAP